MKGSTVVNPFDAAFGAAQSRDSHRRTEEATNARAASDRAAMDARLIRTVAEPLLRSIAPAAITRLRDLGVPPLMVTDRPPRLEAWQHPVAGPSRSLRVGYWSLTAPLTVPGRMASTPRLYLTEDGYFSIDPGLNGPDGFEELLSSARVLDAHARQGYGAPGLFVEPESNCVCMGASYYYGLHDSTGFKDWDFADYVAEQVLIQGNAKR